MIRLLRRWGLFPLPAPAPCRAASRLKAARLGHERAATAVRRAAFDHIDREDAVITTLRATLDRIEGCRRPVERAP